MTQEVIVGKFEEYGRTDAVELARLVRAASCQRRMAVGWMLRGQASTAATPRQRSA
jgi:hypothetical protein